jgi:hypothetical protein
MHRIGVNEANSSNSVIKGGELPELVVPLDYSLRGLNNRHLIEAARKILQPCDRWWMVKVFVKEEDAASKSPILEVDRS